MKRLLQDAFFFISFGALLLFLLIIDIAYGIKRKNEDKENHHWNKRQR